MPMAVRARGSCRHLRQGGRRLGALAGLVLADQRHVDVLQARPAHLQVADRLAVLGEQLADEAGGVLGGVDELLAVQAAADLGLAGDPPGKLGGAAVGDDPAAGQDQDPVGQLLGLVQVVGGEQDRGVLQVGQAVDQVVELAPGLAGRSRRSARPGTAAPAGRRGRSRRPAGAAARRRASRSWRWPARSARPGRPARRRRTAGAAPACVRGVVAAEVVRAARGRATCRGRATTAARCRAGRATPRRRGPGRRRARATSPAERFRNPSRISMVVVLPAPFGPSRATHLASVDAEVDAVEHVVRAVPHPQAADVDDRRSTRRVGIGAGHARCGQHHRHAPIRVVQLTYDSRSTTFRCTSIMLLVLHGRPLTDFAGTGPLFCRGLTPASASAWRGLTRFEHRRTLAR